MLALLTSVLGCFEPLTCTFSTAQSMWSSQSGAEQDMECPPEQGEGSSWADLALGALQVSPGFWASFLILLCLCPVGAAALQTLLILRALIGLRTCKWS